MSATQDVWLEVDDRIRVRVDRRWVEGIVVSEARVVHPRAIVHDDETGQPVYDKKGRSEEIPIRYEAGELVETETRYLDLLMTEERIDETADVALDNGDRVTLVRGEQRPAWERLSK